MSRLLRIRALAFASLFGSVALTMQLGLNVAQLVDEILSAKLDPMQVYQRTVSALRPRNEQLRAICSLDEHGATAAVQRVLTRRDAGAAALPLAGVPMLIKDNVAQAGHPNPAGRNPADLPEAVEDAVVVRRLVDAGAIIVGRANMDELAYGVTGQNPHHGQVCNPWNEQLHPGGSSAGSAAAVAAGMVPLAIGTDTAGSVRIPAALCGIVGLRPTSGWCPTQGVAPLAPSLDCVGPLAACVADVARLLSVLVAEPSVATAHLFDARAPASLRVLALEGAFPVELHPGVRAAFARAIEVLSKLGLRVHSSQVPELAEAARTSGPIIGAEASHAWARELELHPGSFSDTVAEHIKKGQTLTAVRYLRALKDRERIAHAIDALFDSCELLALPTVASPATPIQNAGSQLQFLALTVPFSLSGHPSLSVPMALVEAMPVGLQLVGPKRSEPLMLRVAHLFEQHAPWRDRQF